jgi:hypothetical protein
MGGLTMFVGMINDYPFCCADTEELAKAHIIKIAEDMGYKIGNHDYNGPNKATLDDRHVFVWCREVTYFGD